MIIESLASHRKYCNDVCEYAGFVSFRDGSIIGIEKGTYDSAPHSRKTDYLSHLKNGYLPFHTHPKHNPSKPSIEDMLITAETGVPDCILTPSNVYFVFPSYNEPPTKNINIWRGVCNGFFKDRRAGKKFDINNPSEEDLVKIAICLIALEGIDLKKTSAQLLNILHKRAVKDLCVLIEKHDIL